MSDGRLSGELVAGRELDARVATQVMGWRVEGAEEHGAWVVQRTDGSWAGIANHRFSTVIGAAMEVLDQLGGIVTIVRRKPDEWYVDLGHGTHWAPTLPLAICRAAIAATEPPEPASVPIEGP